MVNNYFWDNFQNSNFEDIQNIFQSSESLDLQSIKNEILQDLNNRLNVEQQEDIEMLLRMILSQNKYALLTDIQKQELMKEILNDITGLGPLQPLIEDPTINEIIVVRYDNIWVEKQGKLQRTDIRFASEEELRKVIDKILLPLGRRVDETQPYVNARLKDKSRVNIVIPPIKFDGASMCIRKFTSKVFTLEDYINLGSMSPQMAEFLKACVIARKNIIVSGGTGSGKTTLLNCLSQYIPEDEAIVTIEDNLELKLQHPCVRSLEARGKNAEGKGEITIRDLLVNALRMRPDRIIIGECRSHEVIDMLQAMNTGHDGSLTTVHANSPEDMIERLYVMYLMGGVNVPEKAVKSQIALAVDLIVQIARLKDGSRKILKITEVVGIGRKGAKTNNKHVTENNLDKRFLVDENEVGETDIILQDIFKFDMYKRKHKWTGYIPTFWEDIVQKNLLPPDFFIKDNFNISVNSTNISTQQTNPIQQSQSQNINLNTSNTSNNMQQTILTTNQQKQETFKPSYQTNQNMNNNNPLQFKIEGF